MKNLIKFKDNFFKVIFTLSLIVVLFIIFGIFIYIFYKGLGVISLEFIFDKPKGIPMGTEGGIFPAIIGTLYLGALSGVFASLIGIPTAMFLVFFSKENLYSKIIQFSLQIFSGLPSILFGLVGYFVLIYKFGIKRSLLTAGITVAVMIIPFVTLRVQKILLEYPKKIMNVSLSLGISKIYTLTKIILPRCFVEILTTVALSIAYGTGATAPIMYTGVSINADVPKSLSDSFMSLPYHLYILANDGVSIEYAYATALVLIVLLLSINITCRLIGVFKDGRN